MKRDLTLVGRVVLVLLAPHVALAQWTEGRKGSW